MTTTINASPTNGLVQTADGSGVLKVQSNGVTTNALAWVNFNGATAAIRASYNVSSVTRSSKGNYVLAFTNALSDINYCAVAGSSTSSGTNWPVPVMYSISGGTPTAPATTGFSVSYVLNTGADYLDPAYCNIAIFGN